MFLSCLATILWFGASAIVTASPADQFKAGNQLYDAGKFGEAIAAYEKIEPKTAHVFYNLGNACFRAHQLGRAVLNYERARLLSPRDPDILANLEFAQERLGINEVNKPSRPISRLLESILSGRTLDEWTAYELAGVWLAALCIGLCLWLPRARMTLAVASIVLLCWVGATATALACRSLGERTAPRAVVLSRYAEARFAPLADATVHFKLAEGTEVAVKEDRGQWWYVERADGQQGWVRSDTAARVQER